ncbi:sugar ABC transporter ATP-binding protein [Adhaeretor mobilis]|uniref:Galactose/methyl galactoside import ATP-binding protein MglA n=1 Tax=Adhaeretor mobilis TaxID=1930276 RepID=A0A517MTT7_9BACT|nr:sugar ABC transporter ATP-binding protein [Adhaeretor mobilis]QDS98301.1 Galactose/methyl galactoside import ATP-binding protein MglA [Adhaeretor mobilis]
MSTIDAPAALALPLLEVRGVTKHYSGVCALKDVDLDIRAGEVHAVIGENGAGKSTLMKILAGVQLPDSGGVFLHGEPAVIDSVHTALELGISMIHQELNLADNLNVGANIFLGREPHRRVFIDFASINRQSQEYLDLISLDVSPKTVVDQLTIGKQQMVEIAKALSATAKILIMDEPTSSLTQHEAEQLFAVIKQLRDQHVAIIYISHRLGEVSELADRVTVLRDGEIAGTLQRNEIDHDSMVQLMVGRDISQFYAREDHDIGAPLLEVTNLRTTTFPQHALQFSVAAGEIVGLAGLVGAGRTEVLCALFGVTPANSLEIKVAGKPIAITNPRDAIDAGLALVPEDRKQQGLFLDMSIRQNIGTPGLARHQRRFGFLNTTREREDSAQMSEEMHIKSTDDQQQAQYLSGGNQQKVVLGKWLAMQPRVLLLDEPTRGVDIGAKQEIYRLMEELAEQGVAILFVSSEMEEVLSMSDRVLVMHEGQITGQLARDQLTEEAVMQLATGSSPRVPATVPAN